MLGLLLGEDDGWMGFARLDDRYTQTESRTTRLKSTRSVDLPQYIDDRGRTWNMLSLPYSKESRGGLLNRSEGSSIIQTKKPKKKADENVVLDEHYAKEGYTPELYESACQVVGEDGCPSGATWRLNTGGGYFHIRFHVVDWWHWPAKDNGAPRIFDILFSSADNPQIPPERHTIQSPVKNFSKVIEFLYHVEPEPGMLDIEVRSSVQGDFYSVPCFSGIEVLKVPKKDIVPAERASEMAGIDTAHIHAALTKEKSDWHEGMKKKKNSGWFSKFW